MMQPKGTRKELMKRLNHTVFLTQDLLEGDVQRLGKDLEETQKWTVKEIATLEGKCRRLLEQQHQLQRNIQWLSYLGLAAVSLAVVTLILAW